LVRSVTLVVFHSPDHLISGALWWLAQLHVVLQEHQSAQLLQHGLDSVLPAPPGENGHSADINRSCARHAVHVNSVDEPHNGRLLRVVVPTI